MKTIKRILFAIILPFLIFGFFYLIGSFVAWRWLEIMSDDMAGLRLCYIILLVIFLMK